MGKKISVTELRNQLGTLLDLLDQGESHFVIERNNREAAVLLSMDKFRDIMQMLELLNTLDFIDAGLGELGQELSDGAAMEFPELQLLRPLPELEEIPPDKDKARSNLRPRERNGASVEDLAAKLGIRIIK
jgi:prevent-host-death family protein